MTKDIPRPPARRRPAPGVDHVWPHHPPAPDLGVIAHGPVVLARAPGTVAGLRAVFAHPDGLHLLTTYRATGGRARDARSWSAGRLRRYPGPTASDPWSCPRLDVTVNGRTGPVDTPGPIHHGEDGVFAVDAWYRVGDLPRDGRVVVTVEWPHAGLPLTETVLTLTDLSDLTDRVHRLD